MPHPDSLSFDTPVTPALTRIKRHCLKHVVAIATIALIATSTPTSSVAGESVCQDGDRLWLVSTRRITSQACRANVDSPSLSFMRLDDGGVFVPATIDEYAHSIGQSRAVVIYIHGNRMEAHHARHRGLSIYKRCRTCRSSGPIDWVIWSWPSEKMGFLTYDVRKKAERTDAQGLYLAWLLREHCKQSAATTLIGYSFGGRIATGALHALAGGELGGRTLSGSPISGESINAGLIAPAIDSHWLSGHGYHARATTNMHRMLLMYNHRDFILKRYWRVEKIRGRMALGYSGPTVFGPRGDGSKLPVRSRDCSSSIGITHDEMDYYRKSCRAGSEMASLIDDIHLKDLSELPANL